VQLGQGVAAAQSSTLLQSRHRQSRDVIKHDEDQLVRNGV